LVFLNKRTIHRQLVEDVADRYTKERIDPTDDDSFAKRLGAMQRAGVALFHNDRDIKCFIDLVIGRGCTHPFHESNFGQFIKKDKLPLFLRIANARGIRFNHDLGLYEFIVNGYFEFDEASNNLPRKIS